jgi:carbohydrate kinase (thermoresistant glucokinase family)
MESVIIYIIGVSGSGKTTIGRKLSAGSGIPFFDGDDFHSEHNKEKMKGGQPLDDEDRKDWLGSLNQLANEQAKEHGAIIACSALKEKYRKILSENVKVPLHWVFLKGSHALISERMMGRKDHFMPPGLLQSQLQTLETPGYGIVIDITGNQEAIVESIMEELKLRP